MYASPTPRPLSTSEGVQVILGSHVDFPVDDRWCGQDLAVELVSGQDFQFLTAIQHNHNAFLGRKVDLVVGGDGRRVVISQGPRPSAINQFAGCCDPGENDTAVLDRIEAPIVVK